MGALHHVCLYSTDIVNDCGVLRERGLQQILPPGVTEFRGGAAFFHPRSCRGVLLEIWPADEYYPHPQYRGQGLVAGMGHVGLVARDENEARHFWKDQVGLEEDTSKARAASDNVRIIEFPIGGSVIEISVPQDTVSGTARFLQSRNSAAALHHICPWTPDVGVFMERAIEAGLQPIGDPPKPGAGRAVGWLHPRSCMGVLMEVWNRPA